MWGGNWDQQVQLPGNWFGQLELCGAIIQNGGKEKEQGWIKKKIYQILNICSMNKITMPFANKCAGL